MCCSMTRSADVRRRDPWFDPEALQQVRPADAGPFEQERGLDGSAGEDDLLAGAELHGAGPAAACHPDGPALGDQNAFGAHTGRERDAGLQRGAEEGPEAVLRSPSLTAEAVYPIRSSSLSLMSSTRVPAEHLAGCEHAAGRARRRCPWPIP